MKIIFGVLIGAYHISHTTSLSLNEADRLAQAQVTDNAKAIVGILHEPLITLGGTDINLVSANNHKSGNCSGKTKELGSELGSDQWLARQPGLAKFLAQVDTSDQGFDDNILTQI